MKAVVGSCGETGSLSESYAKAAELFPHIVIHMGDLHYQDIDSSDRSLYVSTIRSDAPHPRTLFQ